MNEIQRRVEVRKFKRVKGSFATTIPAEEVLIVKLSK